MPRWPAERGTWVVLGLPWLAGTAAAGSPTALAAAVLLGAALFCAVLAREPLLWSLWRLRRGFPPRPDMAAGLRLAAAAALTVVLWFWLAPGPDHRAGIAMLALGSAGEAVLRLLRPRSWWPGVMGSAFGAAGACLAAGAARSGTGGWGLALGLGYAAGCAMCAMGIHMAKVSRGGEAASAAGALLWGWAATGALPLAAVGAPGHALPLAAAAVGMGLAHAALAQRSPRTLAFRRLGWREAAWLAAMTGMLWVGVRL